MGDELELWKDFNVAIAGATAALAGLVIVAASVNISEIVKFRALTARLAAAIAALVLAIVASALGLIPGISPTWFGILLIVAAVAAGVFQVVASVEIFADDDPAARAKLVKSAFGFFPIAAYLAAGVAVLLGSPAGLFLAAAGSILAIVTAILASWVALVEVLR
jgi:modulator of FtsH protease